MDSNNVRGGIYTVQTIAERDAVPEDKRKAGMLCYVQGEDTYYNLVNGEWQEAKFGSDGVPVYD